MRQRTRIAIAGLLVFAMVAYFGLQQYSEQNKKLGSVTTFSRSVYGNSVLFELFRRTGKTAVLKLNPWLIAEDSKPAQATALFSPTSAPTAREIQTLKSFVREGGRLVLTAHSESTMQAINPILSQLGAGVKLVKNQSYANEKLEYFTPEKESALFSPKEKYAFYSAYFIDEPGCEKTSFDCLVRLIPFEKGWVLLTLGLPLTANGLIGQADNGKFAFRLLDWTSPFYIDEYHHFFSDKTFSDLMCQPAFALTIVGIVVAMLLYFFFAHTEFHERSRLPETASARRNFHDLNRGILREVLERRFDAPDALREQRLFLKRLFPSDTEALEARIKSAGIEVDAINSRRSLLENAKKLARVHRDWLNVRGRKI